MSSVDYSQRQDALLSAAQNEASLQHDVSGASESLAALDVEAARVRAQGADEAAQIEYAKAQIMEKKAQALAQRDVVVLADRAGRIANLSAKIGASIVQGEPLAVLLPEGSDLQAELWIPSRSAGFLRRGDDVGLMYDAFPYQRFGTAKGRVIEIADSPEPPQDLPIQPVISAKENLYKVKVALDRQTMDAYSRSWRLIPGMHLTADLVLQRQTLMDWLLEPVFAARAREQER
jgi:membrane fusion protein